jgi:hypothetical protein
LEFKKASARNYFENKTVIGFALGDEKLAAKNQNAVYNTV